MLESVGRDVPTEDFSTAAFYLIHEVGLNHETVFGGTEYVNVVEEVERDTSIGKLIDRFIGRRKVEYTEKVEKRGMSAKAFAIYLDLFEEYQEEKENQRKKAQMKSKMKGKTLG
jgi:hypothetical protein